MEMINRLGLPTFVVTIAEISFEIVLLVIIISMLASLKEDKKNEFIKKITIPYTSEIVTFYIAVFIYNLANIFSMVGESYPGDHMRLLKQTVAFVYYLSGAFMTAFFLQVIKIDIVIPAGKRLLGRLCTFFQLLQIPLLILLVLTPFTNIIYYIDEDRRYHRQIGYYPWQIITIISFLFIGIAVIMSWNKISTFFRRVIAICVIMPKFAFIIGIFRDDIALNNIAIMISALFIFVLYENNKTAYAVEILQEMDDVQVKLMLSQIKPHFLYNTLNTIIYYSDKDKEKTKNALIDFSQYLRKNIDSIEENGLVRFSKELSHAQKYISLEILRFEDSLVVEYDIKDEMFTLPVLTLQPLVENAVKHGIRKKESMSGKIIVSTKKTDTHHIIKVIDDGVGFDVNSIGHSEKYHIGINNVRKRLMLECKGELLIDSEEGKGTVCTIRIPIEY